LNLHQGISNTIVEHNLIRNTGDDGLAMWSDQNPNHRNAFRHNTVQLPLLANGIGIYGGHDNEIAGNVIADILIEGAGIQVANRFSGTVPLDGVTTLRDNTILRGGSRFAAISADVGAIFLFGKDSPITGTIKLSGNTSLDSSFSGLHLYASRIADVQVDGLTVERPGTVGVQIQSMGAATVTRSRVAGGVYLCADGQPFTLTATESQGLDAPKCAGI
ncbi:MAG TPA: mycodextranase, partial [Micromonosporaceae bacterium]|nr:mycodextranase [Micromonosporaceae bacterium]